jgi:hypothetical protein
MFLLTAACATVGGTRQTIAFDSQPRGLSVSINGGKIEDVLKTPSAVEVKRSGKLRLEYSSGDFYKERLVSCEFRYGTVLIGNIGLAALSMVMAATPPTAGIIFLSGAGLDLVSGNAFECPSLIAHDIVVPEAVQNELQERCAPVFILPPKLGVDDVGLSYALIYEAQGFISRYDKNCRLFVSPADTVAALTRSSFSGSSLKELFDKESERKHVQILRDTKSRRGVDMKIVRQSASQIEIEFKLWDLYTQKEISSFRKNFSRQKFEGLKSGWFRQSVGKSIRLLPNSLALMSSIQSLNLNSVYAVKQEIIRSRTFINLLSVTSVQHPDQFGIWDFGFEAGPSLFFNSIRSRVTPDLTNPSTVTFVEENQGAVLSQDFTGYALAVPFDTSVAFHTPAGAFRGFLGLGMGLYKPTSSQSQNSDLRGFPLVHVGVDWVAYSSPRFFSQLGLHGFGRVSKSNSIEERKHLNFSSWSSVIFGFGYYFPDTQGYLESLLVNR